jgi:hypothetical protein
MAWTAGGVASRRAISPADGAGTHQHTRSLEQRDVVRCVGGHAAVPATSSAGNDTRDPTLRHGVDAARGERRAEEHELAGGHPSWRSRL